jgi:fatty acid desaturase
MLSGMTHPALRNIKLNRAAQATRMDIMRVRGAMEERRFEAGETAHRIAVWLVVAAVALYVGLAYAVGSLIPWWP